MYNSLDKIILNTAIINTTSLKGIDKRTLQNKMQNLVKNGKVVKLKNGLYAMVNPLDKEPFANKFELATSMYSNAYIVFHTALEYYGLSNQIYNLVQVATAKIERKLIFDQYTFKFYKGLGNDYVDTIMQNSIIRVTSIERTIVDCIINSRESGGIEEVAQAISSITYIDEKKLLDVMYFYNKPKVYQKVGFIIDMVNHSLVSEEFYKECKSNMNNKIYDIRENKKVPSYIDKKWNVIVPKYLINEVF